MISRRFVGSSITVSVLVAVPLFAFLCPMPARAAVVWTATFETGDLSEWTSGTNSTKTLADGTTRNNVEVLGEQVYRGKLAGKITVHPDDDFGQYHQDRVDIKHDSTLTGEGKDSYLSGYYFLPEDAQTRDEIAFYETKVTSRNWMDLWIEPKTGGGTTVKFGIESDGANLGSVLVWTGDWKAAQWHQFAIHVHWSTDATKGVVDLWLDGQQVVTAYKHKTKFDANDMFFQTGLHRVLMQPSTETIYLDDFIEADTEAEVKIGAPTVDGADAGAADAASATDAAGVADAGGNAAGNGTMGTAGEGTTTGGAGNGTAGAAGTSGADNETGGASGGTGGAGAKPNAGKSTSGGCQCATTGGAGASLSSLLVMFALTLRVRRARRLRAKELA